MSYVYNNFNKRIIIDKIKLYNKNLLPRQWFTVIRNPLTRVVSAFNMLKYGNEYLLGKRKKDSTGIIDSCDIKYYRYPGLKLFNSASDLLEALTDKDDSVRNINAKEILRMHHLYEGYHFMFSESLGKSWLRRNAKYAKHVAVLEDQDWFDKLYLSINGKKPPKKVKQLRKNDVYSKELTKKAKLNYYNYAKNTEYKTLEEFVKYGLLDKQVYDNYVNYVFN
jgi:hypothetical protein